MSEKEVKKRFRMLTEVQKRQRNFACLNSALNSNTLMPLRSRWWLFLTLGVVHLFYSPRNRVDVSPALSTDGQHGSRTADKFLESLCSLFSARQVNLVANHNMRPTRKPGLVLLQFVTQNVQLLTRVCSTEVDDKQQTMTALDVPEKRESQTAIQMRVLDDARDIGNWTKNLNTVNSTKTEQRMGIG